MKPFLSLENVSFGYQGTKILQHITFDVKAGEFIGIIGPNGGGKTTLLKLILGFLKPATGKIFIEGKSPTASRRAIAYVPQTARFDKEFPISVLEVVLGGRLFDLPWYGKFKQEDKDKALNALKKVGLSRFAHRAFGTLSGGQAQRVLIARALASEPKLLLLDEPTASVDSESEAEIYALLKELKGITILMVTHDLNAIINDVQRIICVQNKAISLQPHEVCEHFAFGLYHSPLLKSEP